LHTVNYLFEVKPVKTQTEMLLAHIALGIGLTIALVLLVLCVIYCRRIAVRKEGIIERLRARLKRRIELQHTAIKVKPSDEMVVGP